MIYFYYEITVVIWFVSRSQKKFPFQITVHVLKVTPSYWRDNFDKRSKWILFGQHSNVKGKTYNSVYYVLGWESFIMVYEVLKEWKLLENWEGTTAFLRAFRRGMPERNIWEGLFTGARHMSSNVPVVSNLPHLKPIHHT